MGPVLFCGDLHGRFRHVNKTGLEMRASALVLLGDIEAQRPLDEELQPLVDAGIPILFIVGNHDSDKEESLVNLLDSKLAAGNIGGRSVVLPDGRRIAGLPGIWRGGVWDPRLPEEARFRNREEMAAATPWREQWREQVPLRHWSSTFPDEFDRLADLQADILISHEAPGYHPWGFALLDDLVRSVGATVSVHGHQHDSLDSSSRWDQQQIL